MESQESRVFVKLTLRLKRCSSISFLRFSMKLRFIGDTSPASIMMRSFEDPKTKQLVPLSAAASLSVSLNLLTRVLTRYMKNVWGQLLIIETPRGSFSYNQIFLSLKLREASFLTRTALKSTRRGLPEEGSEGNF